MALFTIKNPKVFNVFSKILFMIIPFVLGLFVVAFIILIYQGVESKDLTKFCYGLFAANAIICSSLLSLGRSPYFVSRYSLEEQKPIYWAGIMFLYSTIISFLIVGWIFVNTDTDFFGKEWPQSSELGHIIIMISYSLGILLIVLFSIIGIFYFFKWSRIASKRMRSEMNEGSGVQ